MIVTDNNSSIVFSFISSLHNPIIDETLYCNTIGASQYVTITRPDITFSINKVCQFMVKPTTTHWFVVKWILRFLKGIPCHGFKLQISLSLTLSLSLSFDIQSYTDIDRVFRLNDHKSTSGFVSFLAPT